MAFAAAAVHAPLSRWVGFLLVACVASLTGCVGTGAAKGPDGGTYANAKDTSGADAAPIECTVGDPVPDSLEIVGRVLRITGLTMQRPTDPAGAVKSALNGIWAKDIAANKLNIYFRIDKWDLVTHELTLAVGTGLYGADKDEHFWDAAPSLIDLVVDNPGVRTEGAFGLGTLDIAPETVSKPIHIIHLGVDAIVTCDATAILDGGLEGSLRRLDAEGLEVQLGLGGAIDMVKFLEGAEIFPDKVVQLEGLDQGAAPCRSDEELAAGKVQTPWCITATDHALHDATCFADCAKSKLCDDTMDAMLAADPNVDDDAMRAICVCASHIEGASVLETRCVIADAWQFAGKFGADLITNFNNARIGK